MQIKKVFDMEQTRSQTSQDKRPEPMTYKRIIIDGVSPKEEIPEKKTENVLTQKQTEYKIRQRKGRIASLQHRIEVQEKKVSLMPDGAMKVRMVGKLNHLKNELKSLEGESDGQESN